MITVQTTVQAPLATVWDCWTLPEHITQWCQASDDWHAPHAENDLRAGGRFVTTMAAKDGSFSFDFSGEYTRVVPHSLIEYSLDDERKVRIEFLVEGDSTHITEHFDAEQENPEEMQQAGWQAILESFKRYVEGLG
ncbi:MAG: polyketide cyclase [Bacteroidetes bacterium]|nr:MAG: polyketide cyclase [Bacteroidota bacterium]